MKYLLLTGVLLVILSSCTAKDSKIDRDNSIDVVDTINEKTNLISEDVTLEKAPEFNLPDINGTKKSLKDFEGNLIYLDIWATWCGPCRMQIPAMKELANEYSDKGIVFLSISVDPEKNKDKWKQMILEEKMSGEHLYAGVTSSSFGYDYKVEFIPRFMLISSQGEIIMDHAPQPMDFTTKSVNSDLKNIFDIYLKTNNKK